ncbi:MAG: RNA methyltransferase [Bacteroidota bacterium]
MENSDNSFKNPVEIESYRTPERTEKLLNILKKRQPTLTIVLENVHDPHNVSAVIRSCDAVGVLEVCLVYHSGQKFPQLGEKSSASARKWVEQRHFTSVEECFKTLKSEGKKIFTTHMASDAVSLYDMNLTKPVALVFGNEHSGVSQDALKLADGNFLIPQVGVIQSLNISVACAVTLYEAYRQRAEAGMYDDIQFEESAFKIKAEEWLKR